MKNIKTKTEISLFHPYVSPKAIIKVVEVLQSKFIGQGPLVSEFEKRFAERFKIKYAVSTNSCTAALHLAYLLAGVGKGDEVVGPLHTSPATWHPVLQLGGRPVFCDIKDDFTMDPDDLEKKITKRTKAIVVMHYGGRMCEMDKIMKIARRHKLPVVEDAAQALGAKYRGKYAGTIGDYGCFSFQAIKYLTTVDGGMLTMKNREDYEKAKRLRWFGIDRDWLKKIKKRFKDWERREATYDIWEAGYKYHMNSLNAAIGLVHLEELAKILKHQKTINNLYRKLLGKIAGLEFLPRRKGDTNWLMTVLADRRNDFARTLEEGGVETNVVHVRNDAYTVFKPYVRSRFPKMDLVQSKYLCLPIHMHVSEGDVKYIYNLLKNGW